MAFCLGGSFCMKKNKNIKIRKYGLLALFLLVLAAVLWACAKGDKDDMGSTPDAPVFTKSEDGTAYVFEKYYGNDTQYTVPATYEGLPVTEIGLYAFSECDTLTSVTLPAGITSIGHGAFSRCSQLTSIHIPASVQQIADRAFYQCTALTSLTFDEGCRLESIGIYAFSDCTSLLSVKLPAATKSIGHRAFADCAALTSVAFEENAQLQSMGTHAFYHDSALKSFTLPDTLTEIPDYTFNGCTALRDLTISESTTLSYIGDYAFQNCRNIASLRLPPSLREIGLNTFAGCHKLLELLNFSPLELERGTTKNGGVAYYALDIHTGKSKMQRVNDYLFYSQGNSYALLRYDGTDTNLTLPNKINGNGYVVYQYAFYRDPSITSVTLPSAVTNVGAYAFYECKNLVRAELPKQLAGVGVYAFDGCDKLAFSAYEGALYLGSPQAPYTVLVRAQSRDITACNIHADTTVIAAMAFLNCGDLAQIVIPKGLITLGTQSFQGCSNLKTVTFVDGSQLNTLGANSFYSCYRLESVKNLPAGISSVPSGLFYDCGKLSSIQFGGTTAEWRRLLENAGSGWNDNTPTYTVSCKDGTLGKE